jgi:uncharacterized protein YndB with AHSA1/START domain
MTEQRPFRVEVVVAAPRDAVWRALTEPREIRRWFGWDYEEDGGLDGEIEFIFVTHAKQHEPDRIDFGNDQTIELEADGPRTVVRVVCPGSLADAGWEDLYDDYEQGWRVFFAQLRHALERHPGEERRTVYLTGTADPAAVLAALDGEVAGEPWDEGRFQRSVALDGGGDEALVSVRSRTPLASGERGEVAVTVTTYGLGDAAFEAVRGRWAAWWAPLAADVKVTP